ncbi:MAG: ABC transporter substrate-binding protein [Chloroflexi bacterium]|nr:ABC transporter substrate-binding protein [Chloroflexota bacterium]
MRPNRLAGLLAGLLLVSAGCSATASTAPAASAAAGGGSTASTPAAAASAPGASSGTAFTPPNLSGKKLTIVVNGDLEQSKIDLAHAYDLLRQWGLNLTVNYGGTSQVVMAAMVSGQAQVLEFSVQGSLASVNNGVNLQAFALAQPRQDYALIGRPNIKTMADLKGKSIGVLDTVGLNGVQATLALDSAGLTQKDVSIVQAGGQGSRVSALVAGRIDATMVGFSNYLQLKSQGYNLLYSYTKSQPNLWDDVLWATPQWLSQNADIAVAMNEAVLESFRWFDNPANKQAYVDASTSAVKGLDASVASQMYDIYQQNSMYPPNAILTDSGMAFNQTAYFKAGSLPKQLPISQICNTTYAQQALQAVGQAQQ